MHYIKFKLTICGKPITRTSSGTYSQDIDIVSTDSGGATAWVQTDHDLLTFFTGETTDCPIKEFQLKEVGTDTVFPPSNNFVVSTNTLEIKQNQEVADFTFDVKPIIPLVTAIDVKTMIFRMGCFHETGLAATYTNPKTVAYD